MGEVMRVVEAQGVIRANPQGFVKVGSRIKGQVLRLHVRTGDVVRAGQLLAELDDRELQAQRAGAQARLEAARNEADRLEKTADSRLEEARAQAEAGKGRHVYAEKNLERRKSLEDRGHIPQSDLDAASRDARTTAQEVARDRSAVERVDRDSRHTLAAARKAVDEARAAVAQVDAFLSMTRIQSPIDGIVGQVLTQEGEQVVAELEAVKLLTVIDPRFLEAWVFINEADAAGVRPGMPVRLFTPFRQDQVFTAQVERLSPVPEAVDRVLYYPAIAPLGQEAARFLRPEMNVQCFVMVEHLPQALSVPNEAVMQRGGRRVVWVEDGRGGLTAVEPVFGVRGNARTQVLSGLETGQRVALKLAPGGGG